MQSSPFQGLITLATFCFALVVAITFHEFSHSLAATLLGDPTSKSQGRLTLQPLAHLDPIGSAMILFAGFGWGKPVPVNPAYLQTGARPGMAVVSLAGPLANVIVAAIAAIPIKLGVVSTGLVGFALFRGQMDDVAPYVIGTVVFLNLLLAAFNLIPVPPLDGFKIALGVLPRDASNQFAQLERYGPMILLSLIMLDFIIPGVGILTSVMRPIINALAALVLGGHVW